MKDLGKAGDLVYVKEGFARNFLLPKKLACMATERRMKEWKHLEKMAEIKRKKNKELLQKTVESLSQVTLNFSKPTTASGDRLFGSVTAVDIAKQLQNRDFEVNRHDVKTEPLKTLGEHKITVSFSKEMKTDITVIIEKEAQKKEGSEKTVSEKSSESSES